MIFAVLMYGAGGMMKTLQLLRLFMLILIFLKGLLMMPRKLLFIVNKPAGFLPPLETFLLAHYWGMKCETIPLIGDPGRRCLDFEKNQYLLSVRFIPLLLRWLMRKLRLSSSHRQDTMALFNFIKNEKIDAVLAEYGPTAVSVMDACSLAKVPLIAHFHGWDAYTNYNIATYGHAYRRLFSQAVAVIAVSQHMRNQLISLGANPETVFYNSCGAEISDEIKAEPESSDVLFVMVGRLTQKKAPQISIKAFYQVLKHYPEAKLEIIGDGELRDNCEQLISDLNLSEHIFLRGAQPHSEVMAALSRARCFIQHSVHATNGDHEGTPVGVLEAMGMGLPVVATRHGGIMDVIKSDDIGLLVDEHDIEGMATSMMKFAEDPVYAQKVGDRAREVVLSNWTSEKSTQRLWNIIEKTTNK